MIIETSKYLVVLLMSFTCSDALFPAKSCKKCMRLDGKLTMGATDRNDNADTKVLTALLPPILSTKQTTIHEFLLQRAIQMTWLSSDHPNKDLLVGVGHSHLVRGPCWHSVLGMRLTFAGYMQDLFRRRAQAAQEKEHYADLFSPSSDPCELLLAQTKELAAAWKTDLKELAEFDSVPEREQRKERKRNRRQYEKLMAHHGMTPVSHFDADTRPVRYLLKRSEKPFDPNPRSPLLRAENVELLLRFTTLGAVEALEAELERTKPDLVLSAWFHPLAEDWRAKLSAVDTATPAEFEEWEGDGPRCPKSLALELLTSLSLLAPHTEVGVFIDPQSVVERLLDHREARALELVKQLASVDTQVVEVRKGVLESTMRLSVGE